MQKMRHTATVITPAKLVRRYSKLNAVDTHMYLIFPSTPTHFKNAGYQ